MAKVLEGTKLGFVGSGVMAEAIVSGVIRQGLIKPEDIHCADPYAARCEEMEKLYGVRTTTSNKEAIKGADVVFLSIKPQVLPEVARSLLGSFNSDQLIISILAGVDTKTLKKALGHSSIVRTMPNTPARVGEGMTVWMATEDVTKEQQQKAQVLLAALGEEVFVTRESDMDMATALSGTGPAYVFLFMEALIDAGVHMGFSRRVAEKLVLQTVKGSVDFALKSDTHLAELRNQVTSPGGTTADALYHMEKGGMRTVLSKAVFAAFQKSQKLSTLMNDEED